MRISSFPFAALILVAAIVATLWHPSPDVLACAPAPPPGHWVSIREEAALIVWDAKTQTEHFIRRAAFNTDTPNFGFLVPTPTQPELGEADDAIFNILTVITAPPIKYVDKHIPGPPPAPKSAPGMVRSEPPPQAAVEVLEERQVAGFDAAVLKAEDVESLAEWLKEHEYAFRDELRDWLKEYTDHKWIITAFKVSKHGGGLDDLEMKSVRMSFKTDRPFYPYREPEDMRDPAKTNGQGRTLRVFFLGHERVAGALGLEDTAAKGWPGRTVWSKKIASTAQLWGPLKLEQPPEIEHAWLTEFEDRASPRPGTDELYFSKSDDQKTVEKPPVIIERIVYDGYALPPGPTGPVALRPAPKWITFIGGALLLGALVFACIVIACVWPLGRTRQEER